VLIGGLDTELQHSQIVRRRARFYQSPCWWDKTRVEGEDNIYFRRHADGSIVYLVLWTEDGKPKSKTTGGDLADALAFVTNYASEG
jgi:hypothetical protein